MRCLTRSFFLFGLLIFSLGRAESVEGKAPSAEFRFQLGDDPRWAAPDWDDRGWEHFGHPVDVKMSVPWSSTTGGIPSRTGVCWVRVHVERSQQRHPGPVFLPHIWLADEPGFPINSLFLTGAFAYEVFWDGRLIGASGRVGTDRSLEIAGPLDNLILIPADLLGPGPHVIALRLSSFHYNFPQAKFVPGFFSG